MAAEYISTPIPGAWKRELTGFCAFYCTCGAEKTGDRSEVKPVFDDHIARFGPALSEACADINESGLPVTTTIINGALPVHHTATVDTPWDGPEAQAAMPNDAAVLRYCHAYADSEGNPDAKSSYSFPHHKTEGGPANLSGCRNGLSRLANSTIPAADKPGVERHLRAHLADGGSEEPGNHNHSHVMNGPGMTRPAMRQWFSIRNADDGDGPAAVYIYDMIGPGFFSDGVLASDFVTALAGIKSRAIDLHINSPGGDVFDAIAIYNALRRHPAAVTTYIDGLAASAASFIAQAGDKVIVERNAQFMVHDASGVCMGNAADMAKMADLLNKASDNVADIYSQRSGVDQSTWREVMRAEAWYSSSEAVIAGLADEVGDHAPDDERLTATARFAPVLKALGARYSSRAESPDPVLAARAAVSSRESVPRPGLDAAAIAAICRPVALARRPAAAMDSPTLLTLQQVLTLAAVADNAVDQIQPLLADLLGVPNPDIDAPPDENEPDELETAAPAAIMAAAERPDSREPVPFDPAAAFRDAVKAGLAAKRR